MSDKTMLGLFKYLGLKATRTDGANKNNTMCKYTILIILFRTLRLK